MNLNKVNWIKLTSEKFINWGILINNLYNK